VLAAVDFGDASARAVAIAGLIASAFGARFRALHSERFEPPPYFTVEQIARLEAERRGAEAAASRHLATFVATATAYPVEPVVLDEPPVDAILHAATHVDLVVMGSHRRRRPARWWLGSVAERVVRASTVPVLVTRESDVAVLETFARVVLVGDAVGFDGAARACAESIVTTFGGRLTDAGPLTACAPEVIEQATLVVVATAHARPSWGIPDAVALALGACERPVLFVPSR
jgi:nucleotide-binding universal stress UspA family protein